MSVTAAIYAVEGLVLTPDEKAFLRDAEPWAFTIFGRNIEGPRQLARLCGSLRDAVGRDCLIFIDQEGGRVQRLKPPTWRQAPPAGSFGALWDREPELALEAVRLNHALIAAELRAVGVDADYAPCCDIAVDGADAVIGDRAFHAEPDAVAGLARAALDGLGEAGVPGVIKHIPGHGRADVDSHHALPRVREPQETLEQTDFAAFRGVASAPMAMTAHVVYEAVDPEACATLSPGVISEIIRGVIGFEGLLMTDDLSMKALDGSLRARAERSIGAGCDMVMHCNGRLAEMIDLAHAVPALDGAARQRADAALAVRGPAGAVDPAEALARMEACFAKAGLTPQAAASGPYVGPVEGPAA
jgi:beta-N-acetylhexosaminidase